MMTYPCCCGLVLTELHPDFAQQDEAGMEGFCCPRVEDLKKF